MRSAVAGVGKPTEVIYMTRNRSQYWYIRKYERKNSSMLMEVLFMRIWYSHQRRQCVPHLWLHWGRLTYSFSSVSRKLEVICLDISVSWYRAHLGDNPSRAGMRNWCRRMSSIILSNQHRKVLMALLVACSPKIWSQMDCAGACPSDGSESHFGWRQWPRKGVPAKVSPWLPS